MLLGGAVFICVFVGGGSPDTAKSGPGRKFLDVPGEKSNFWEELLEFSMSVPSTNLQDRNKASVSRSNQGLHKVAADDNKARFLCV